MSSRKRQKARSLGLDEGGATVVEFAVALPLLVTMMIGTLQFALVLHASGAVRHALGEGIRHAKVYPEATESEVLAVTRSGMQGVNLGGIEELTFNRGVANNAQYGRVTMRYRLEPVIPFAAVPPILIEESRQAYLPS
jgi:Flp pilus assembly pilin Flp